MKKINYISILTILFTFSAYCQNEQKIPLDHSVYEKWKSLQNAVISSNGQWISWEINPQKGDGWLYLYNTVNGMKDSFERGYEAKFSPNANYIVFKIKPQYDTVRKLKLAKTKKEKLPADTLAIIVFRGKQIKKIPRVKSYKIAEENTDWMAYLLEKELKEDKKSPKDTTKIKKEEKSEKPPDTARTEKVSKQKEKSKKEKEQSGTNLVICNPVLDTLFKFKNCDEYVVAKKGSMIVFTTIKKDSVDSTAVHVFTGLNKTLILENKPGTYKSLNTDDPGKQLAFIFSKDTAEKKNYSLFYWNTELKNAEKFADTTNKDIPAGWGVSENGNPYFSDDGKRLYFTTAPRPIPDKKDTLLDEEKVRVDVWNWKDTRLQSQQLKELRDDQKKSYLAVTDLKNKDIFQLGDSTNDNVTTIQKGNGNVALGYSNKKYQREASWTDDIYNDVYVIDLKKKTKTLALVKCRSFSLSPGGNYILWYEAGDSSWYCRNIKNNKTVSLTKNINVNFYNEEHDVPSLPSSYGFAGWTEGDRQVLIYDKYDIWLIDPAGKEKQVNLTNNFGRRNSIIFRYVKLDKEAQFINSKESQMLKAFYEKTKNEGFFRITFNPYTDPQVLVTENYRFSIPVKATHSEILIWKKSNFIKYPDLWYSNIDFTGSKQISITNPQQKKYLWGTVEPVTWTSLTGEKLDGLLYKPENFDPSKKYPMIVYFYERYSDNINNHYIPQPSSSVINFPLYTSNGYLIFIPDITYHTGYPGRSAYDAIISGTLKLCERPYVDKNRLGLQGQSWGGYQVAYLVTQTNLFAAAMAGAPVSNMTSAYGGLRMESGVTRMFLYEAGQSRIGATLWEKPDLYRENSALFYADKIQTPVLIMSNDNDGAVPWEQGVEFFNALRRLDKPAWLLCYNGGEHNLTKWPDRVDLSIRMMQFFDHFLKGAPEPEWLAKGLPAIEKSKNNGYKLIIPKK